MESERERELELENERERRTYRESMRGGGGVEMKAPPSPGKTKSEFFH